LDHTLSPSWKKDSIYKDLERALYQAKSTLSLKKAAEIIRYYPELFLGCCIAENRKFVGETA